MRITAQLPLNEVVTRRAELVAALHHAMDETLWHKGKEEGGITVEYGHPVFHHGDQPCEVEGFHIVSEESGITLDDVASYFHDACHFADTSNSMGTRSQIIAVRGAAPKIDDYEALVRTGFQLPPPLQNREFLHYVTSMRTTDRHGRPCIIFAYHSFLSNSTTFEGEAIPPQWDGYYRCPQYPSGQRATLLKNGNIRIEHCMTYSLKGKIGKWVQNNLFHYGHLDAYYNEWAKAMQVLRQEGKTSPASSATTETRKKGIELYKNVGSFKMPRGYEE